MHNCIKKKIKKISIVLFVGSIPRGIKMKDICSQIKGKRTYLKSFPGTKSKQLNHSLKPTLDNTNKKVP